VSSIVAQAQLACLLEASARKPGNVSPGRHFADTRYEDFLASAAAIGGPLAGVAERPLGATIRLTIEATARFTRANTNLGIVLLLVPLARAAATAYPGDQGHPGHPGSDPGDGAHAGSDPGDGAHAGSDPGDGAHPGSDPDDASNWGQAKLQELPLMLQELRTEVRRVLAGTTVDDAREVYAAIRLASPGGLGRVQAQDVAAEPTATLVEVMQLAAHRDGIAREYATGFATTFESGVPALARARQDGLSWDDAVVETFLTLLATAPDTHVMRRGGSDLAVDVSRRAASVVALGGVRSAEGRRAIEDMDATLRDGRNTANPGTTADLTAAAICAFLLAGGWNLRSA
jgi:triphosphoribosyl-dephospho-CoA synthetase